MIAKTLKSAIANAENNNNLRAEPSSSSEAAVGEGPTLKRFQPKARGSAGPIRKRTSHIRIIVTDEIEIKTREPRKPARRRPAALQGQSRSNLPRSPPLPRRARRRNHQSLEHQKPPRRESPAAGSQIPDKAGE